MSLDLLAQRWIDAKEAESRAVANRREIEDELISLLGEPKDEGTFNYEADQLKVTVTQRMTRRVDADLLQEIAIDAGLFDHLKDLFRWKPEINMRAWRDSDPAITGALAAAITTTPSKPSFKIEAIK